jgi:menaquinol-cytochrome c reductase iron-sulfur subunit
MSDQTVSNHSPSEKPRRNFLYASLAVIFGGIVTVVPVLSGLRTFFDPVIKKKKAGGGGEFVEVTSLNSIPESGEPVLFNFDQKRFDAWNQFSFHGSVFIRRKTPDELTEEKRGISETGNPKDPVEVQVLHPTCPHLGCAVSFEPGEKLFVCPCHNSKFEIDGKQTAQCVSLRPMDQLEAMVDPKTKMISIKYKNFKGSIPEKIEES